MFVFDPPGVVEPRLAVTPLSQDPFEDVVAVVPPPRLAPELAAAPPPKSNSPAGCFPATALRAMRLKGQMQQREGAFWGHHFLPWLSKKRTSQWNLVPRRRESRDPEATPD
jgi:hypothetical protein